MIIAVVSPESNRVMRVPLDLSVVLIQMSENPYGEGMRVRFISIMATFALFIVTTVTVGACYAQGASMYGTGYYGLGCPGCPGCPDNPVRQPDLPGCWSMGCPGCPGCPDYNGTPANPGEPGCL